MQAGSLCYTMDHFRDVRMSGQENPHSVMDVELTDKIRATQAVWDVQPGTVSETFSGEIAVIIPTHWARWKEHHAAVEEEAEKLSAYRNTLNYNCNSVYATHIWEKSERSLVQKNIKIIDFFVFNCRKQTLMGVIFWFDLNAHRGNSKKIGSLFVRVRSCRPCNQFI